MQQVHAHRQSGQIILEVVVGVAIAAFFIIGSASLAAVSLQSTTEASQKNQAILFAQTSLDEVKTIRDSAWVDFDKLSTCTSAAPCHTEKDSNGKLVLLAGSESITGTNYVEKVWLDCVFRNTTTGNIGSTGSVCADSPSGFYKDPATRKVKVKLEWDNATQNIEYIQYFSRYENEVWNQSDWDGSVNCSTYSSNSYCVKSQIDNATDGQIRL